MKNKIFKILITILIILVIPNISNSVDEFNFNITEIEILENGNKFRGTKRGKIVTDNSLSIEADEFEYNKELNIFNAKGNVRLENLLQNYIIYSDDITYLKNQEKVFTSGYVTIDVQSKYNINSEDLVLLINEKNFISEKKTTIKDNKSNFYSLEKFSYLIDTEELKGEEIIVITNYNLPKSDKFFFKSGMINLKEINFLAQNIEINLHKDVFGESKNDPRLLGVSAESKNNKTQINKGVFTSCKKSEGCPPWSIHSEKIIHDRDKKQLIYKNAFLKIYDVPVLFLPKFFHPDPTVKRQSGLLKPELNNSNVLGTSLTIPYYKIISDNKDYTFIPTFFDNKYQMFQNEYRQVNKYSNFIADFAFVNNYKSPTSKTDNSITHLFTKFDKNLDLKNFNSSNLLISFEKVSNDTYLKIFDQNIQQASDPAKSIKPKNQDILNNKIQLSLDHENYNLKTGFESYENLQKKNNDRFQYILPYYNFNKILSNNFANGSLNINSNGTNDLNNTNVLKSSIVNDISYQGNSYISNYGFNNNINIELKNLNSVGKNDTNYKSSPDIELMSIFEVKSSLPLVKEQENFMNYITPKASLRFNPSDMKNHSQSSGVINADNIFNLNRLGLTDSLESGQSLTLGVDYKREKLENINKYFEFKLATNLRNEEEKFIPTNSTLNKKNSNFFGSITNSFSDNFNLDYNFAIDNNLDTFNYHEVSTLIDINNFSTKFNYIESSNEIGNTNLIENNTSYKIDEKNYLNFNTRKNIKIDLTEYYDLVYEYKNDCLTAGVKYKKTYYQDRDLKPTENLFFTITLFPLTTYEQKFDQ